jgi:DNA-binding beta-propeller fold protein YncE
MFAGLFLAFAVVQGNAPTPPPPCVPTANQFVCGQEAPEDLVVLPGSEWVIASDFGGSGGIRLISARDRNTTMAYPSSTAKEKWDAKTYNSCPGIPDAAQKARFRTHGLALRPGKNSVHTLYAVHHGTRESVEVFEVDTKSKPPSFTWVGCAVAPEPIGLNSVVPLPEGGFAATNYLVRSGDASARTKMMAGEKNGEIWEWHTVGGWKIIPGSEAAGANGLEVSKDGRTLYVAAWGSQSFFRLSRGEKPPKREEIPLGFRVDNIRWAADGSLLAAGQGGAAPASQTSNVVKIDPKTLKVQELIREPNSPAFGSGTVAVEVGKELWVGSFRGDRIARFPAQK